MKTLAIVVSMAALAATLVPSVLFLMNRMDLGQVHGWMLAATVVWFASVPFWLGRKG